MDGGCLGSCPASKISHLILIVQENHTFDSYFAHYCTAAVGSNPTCTAGPSCCEAGPATDPSGASPLALTDGANGGYDPNHTQVCELAEMDDGGMDRYATGASCSSPHNVAYASSTSAPYYWQLAATGALADRYFQPVAGASTSNDMYFARAHFVFVDDSFEAEGAVGADCQGGPQATYTDPTIANLIIDAGFSFRTYAGGYAAAMDAGDGCPAPPPDCPAGAPGYPCTFDPGDIPFEYFPSLRDQPAFIADFTRLAADLDGGGLPSVSFVKAIGYETEHPGGGDTISAGEAFVQGVVEAVEGSRYAADTLILITWDESGGYFDHVAPPLPSSVDGVSYGPRIPLLAVGPFARINSVSHVEMEHSSIVRFIEWNWLAQQTGQLGTRDATVNNIGSLLDPQATGVTVPE